jgi:hypothetical protein
MGAAYGAIFGQLGGAIMTAVGEMIQSNEEMKAARYRIRQYLRVAAEEEESQRRELDILKNQQRGSLARTGVELIGTPLEQILRNVEQAELTIRRRRAGNLRAAFNEARQAELTRNMHKLRAMSGWTSQGSMGNQIGAGFSQGTAQTASLLAGGSPASSSLLNAGGYGSGNGLYGGGA